MTSVLLEGAGDHDGVYINDNVGNTFNSLHLFIILLPSLLYYLYIYISFICLVLLYGGFITAAYNNTLSMRV